MRIIAWSVLARFSDLHPDSLAPLLRWRSLLKSAQWKSMADVQRAAPNVKILNSERVRFAVAGGNYRMIIAFDFERGIAFVKFIGTHADYDRIDAFTVSLY